MLSVVATKYAQYLQNPIIFLKSPFFFSNSLSNPRNILRKSAFIQQRSQQQYHLIYHHYSVHYNGSAILRGSLSMNASNLLQTTCCVDEKEGKYHVLLRKKAKDTVLPPISIPTTNMFVRDPINLSIVCAVIQSSSCLFISTTFPNSYIFQHLSQYLRYYED